MKLLAGLIDVEGHGFTVSASVNAFGADVLDTTAPQTASLGHENWVHLWRFHGAEGLPMGYEGLFFGAGAQYHDYDTFNTPFVSFHDCSVHAISKSTT
ncbi:MAG: hypothetical protein VX382_02370 [Candidatus Thermoplasmatota archaeon]|nr:hypothetical protein [Candidatus Thermoplasmatota archaeon]MEC7065084.1 hypothetical protein [Candidatus Thermoplasmatota archaeon]MEC7504394.1 hypothetical protein [Candidatus Thermoplasmatota archaeon]MEC7625413.1 hypothetical protein [Candidatus Thermoplasmatota archaeon]MEC7635667.1 hypothetical protein [Candidatus Thermoplasmatota archaeon]